MANISQITLPDGNTYDIKDANATDTKVTQTQDNSTNDNFEILLAGSTSNTTATEEAKKTNSITFNPSQQAITIGSRKSGSTIGLTSFASGYNVEASKTCSHAEGYSTKASGSSAHSEGSDTTASGNYSHAEGNSTIANHRSQHVFGEYNIADPSAEMAYNRGNYVEIVGNGTEDTRSNARTLDWDGNEWLAGKLTVGANPTNNMDVATKQYADGKVDKAGDTMTGALSMAGTDINLKTTSSSSDDSSDIVWYYGNGNEKARLWTNNEYTAESGLNFRMYKKDGTSLFSGTVPLRNTTYTVASGDSNGQIKVTPSSGSAYNVSVKGLGSAAYLTANTAESNSTVVQRTSSGYVYANYFHTTCGAANPSSYTNSRALFVSDDGFIRRSTAANFRTMLGLGSLATLSSISNYIVVDSVSYDNLSISANNSAQTGNVATTKSGWTALGIIGVSLANASSSGTLYSWCTVYQYAMNSSKQVYAQVRNHYTGGAAKIKVQWFILYIK